MQSLLLEFGERTTGRALCVTFTKATVTQAPFETLEHWCQFALAALYAVVSLTLQSAIALVEEDEREVGIAILLSTQNVMEEIRGPSVSCKLSTHASVSSGMVMLAV
jgi:hypothetical protein